MNLRLINNAVRKTKIGIYECTCGMYTSDFPYLELCCLQCGQNIPRISQLTKQQFAKLSPSQREMIKKVL